MKRIALLILLVLGVLLAGFGLVSYLAAPRLAATYPPPGAQWLPARTAIRLEFSQAMQPESVAERLSIQPARPGELTWQGTTLVFTPEQPWQPGETVQVRLDKGARAAEFPSLAIRQALAWSFTIRQPQLVYLFPSRGAANLHVLDPQTGQDTTLTNLPEGIQDFDLSINGEALYFSVLTTSGSAVYRLDLADGALETARDVEAPSPDPLVPVLVPPAPVLAPPAPVLTLSCPQARCLSVRVSPLGDYLAYESTPDQTGRTQVWVLPLKHVQSAEPPEPFLAGEPDHQTFQPLWSSQGMLAYYDLDAAAYILQDLGSGQVTLFPNQTGASADWHPDGERFVAAEIFFTGETGTAQPEGLAARAYSHLLLFNRRDASTQDLTPGEDLEDTFPLFSPDGSTLAFARKFLDTPRWTIGRQLYWMRLGGGEARQLTNDPIYTHYDFAWSPGGEQLAYVRFNQTAPQEPPELWLVQVSTGIAESLVVGGYAPQWLP
jgi:hypothetical protein